MKRLFFQTSGTTIQQGEIFLKGFYGSYLIGPGPFDLGSEVLHGLVQASVAAQLRLHGGKIRAPLGFVDALLVLLHPGQQVLDVAKGFVVQLGPNLHGGLLDGLQHGNVAHGHRGLQTQVVVAAQVDQALVEAVHPAEVTWHTGHMLEGCLSPTKLSCDQW